MNRALHMAVVTRIRMDPRTRAYVERRRAEGSEAVGLEQRSGDAVGEGAEAEGAATEVFEVAVESLS